MELKKVYIDGELVAEIDKSTDEKYILESLKSNGYSDHRAKRNRSKEKKRLAVMAANMTGDEYGILLYCYKLHQKNKNKAYLNNIPCDISTIAVTFGTNFETAKRNLRRLASFKYIRRDKKNVLVEVYFITRKGVSTIEKILSKKAKTAANNILYE